MNVVKSVAKAVAAGCGKRLTIGGDTFNETQQYPPPPQLPLSLPFYWAGRCKRANPSTVQTQVASLATEPLLRGETGMTDLHGLAEIGHWCRRLGLLGDRSKMGKTCGSLLPASRPDSLFDTDGHVDNSVQVHEELPRGVLILHVLCRPKQEGLVQSRGVEPTLTSKRPEITTEQEPCLS